MSGTLARKSVQAKKKEKLIDGDHRTRLYAFEIPNCCRELASQELEELRLISADIHRIIPKLETRPSLKAIAFENGRILAPTRLIRCTTPLVCISKAKKWKLTLYTPCLVLTRFMLVSLMMLCSHVTHASDPDPYHILRKPIPDKLIILTFDDDCVSHATYVGPYLKTLGFNATFYVSMFDKDPVNPQQYMSFPQIRSLDTMGFEVGNHTFSHGYMIGGTPAERIADINKMQRMLIESNVRKTDTFCWPVYVVNPLLFSGLRTEGYTFARGGHERAYRPTVDHPFDTPSFTFHDERDTRSPNAFVDAANAAKNGRIPIITFHGVPDYEHPSVGLEVPRFEKMMGYLKDNGFTTITMRDLANYVDVKKAHQVLGYRRTEEWGGVTTDKNNIYLCIDKMPASRNVTIPGNTNGIKRAYLLADKRKTPIPVSVSNTGVQSLTVSATASTTYGDSPIVVAVETTGVPMPVITHFTFPGFPAVVIQGNDIYADVPLSTDLTSLSPVHQSGSDRVKTSPISGEARDFSQPQSYTATAPNGKSRAYTVTVRKVYGVIALSNPSFEEFDAGALNEGNNEHGKKPSGTHWNYNMRSPGDEVGIARLTGPISAPPAPDSSKHAAIIHGPGNGISQAFSCDDGRYRLSMDGVLRRGGSAGTLHILIDGIRVHTIVAPKFKSDWQRFETPDINLTNGKHTLALTLDGTGDIQVLVDNIGIVRIP